MRSLKSNKKMKISTKKLLKSF